MEFYPNDPSENRPNLHAQAESDASEKDKNKDKKKKKKTGLPFLPPIETGADDKPQKHEKTAESDKNDHEKSTSDSKEKSETTEEQATGTEEGYQGELVIPHDHTELVLPAVDRAEEAHTDEETIESSDTPDSDSTPEEKIAPEAIETAEDTAEPVPVPPPFWHAPTADMGGGGMPPESREPWMPPIPEREPFRPIAVPAETAERTVSEYEAGRRAYRAEKRGVSRGVASGALVGWLFGRRSGRRSSERALKPQIARNEKSITELEGRISHMQQEAGKREALLGRAQEKVQTLTARAKETYAARRAEVQTRSAEQQAVRRPQSRVETSPATFAIPEQSPATAENTPPTKPIIEATRVMPGSAEQAQAERKKQALPEDQPITEATYQAPEGHRYETSAWHKIEVDNRTGRVVEAPSHEYGHAYHQERQQERLAQNAARAQAAAQVGMTVLSGGMQDDSQQDTVATDHQSSLGTNHKTSRGLSIEDKDYVRNELQQYITSPLIWGIAFMLFLIVVTAGLL